MSQILIVEDEPVIRGALRKLLEQQNYGVAEAESARMRANSIPWRISIC